MNFAKASLFRCFLEAAAVWFGGNIIMGWVSYFLSVFRREPRPQPRGYLEMLADVGFLISNLLMVLLFAAILHGLRKPTGRAE